MISVDVYLTHDNTFSLTVEEGGVPVDLVGTGVTRIVVDFAGVLIDSDAPGEGQGCFDWTTDGASGVVEFDFGELTLTVSKRRCSLVVYDPSHPDGQVWDDFFEMEVHSEIVS